MTSDLNTQSQPETMGSGQARFHGYIGALKRRRVLAALVLLVTASAAFLSTVRQETLYEGTSTVLLSRQNLANSLTNTPDPTYQQADFARIATTQAKIASTPTVASRTIETVGARDLTASAFLARASVEPDPDADLLSFSVRDGSAERASKLATEFAKQFTIYRRELDTAAIERARRELQRRIDSVRPRNASGPAESSRISSDLYDRLIDKDEQLRTLEALQTSNAYLVREAEDGLKVRPQPVRNTIIGIAAGLLLALGLVALVEALDTRVRNQDEVGELLGLPALARLLPPPKKLGERDQLATLVDPHGSSAEGFRLLRAAFEFANLLPRARRIAVTSAVPGEGKSTTVANLAVTMARAGKRVALVDLDLRRPRQHRFFNLDNQLGMTSVAMGYSSLDEALSPINLEGPDSPETAASSSGALAVLSSGPVPPNPADFIESGAVTSLLDDLLDSFDLVLIDTPPALQVSDVLSLSDRLDGVIVVCRLGAVRRPMLRDLRRLLERSPMSRLGYVLTGALAESGEEYGAYSYYGPAEPPGRVPARTPA